MKPTTILFSSGALTKIPLLVKGVVEEGESLHSADSINAIKGWVGEDISDLGVKLLTSDHHWYRFVYQWLLEYGIASLEDMLKEFERFVNVCQYSQKIVFHVYDINGQSSDIALFIKNVKNKYIKKAPLFKNELKNIKSESSRNLAAYLRIFNNRVDFTKKYVSVTDCDLLYLNEVIKPNETVFLTHKGSWFLKKSA